jgi:hypothetical protein
LPAANVSRKVQDYISSVAREGVHETVQVFLSLNQQHVVILELLPAAWTPRQELPAFVRLELELQLHLTQEMDLQKPNIKH